MFTTDGDWIFLIGGCQQLCLFTLAMTDVSELTIDDAYRYRMTKAHFGIFCVAIPMRRVL